MDTPMKVSMESLINRLEKIAKRNEDRFNYKILIEPTRTKLEYSFLCEETGDGHEFVSGYGQSVDEAITDAWNSISESCEDWSYEDEVVVS